MSLYEELNNVGRVVPTSHVETGFAIVVLCIECEIDKCAGALMGMLLDLCRLLFVRLNEQLDRF